MTIARLDALDDPRLDVYARLTEHQLRSSLHPEQALFVAESRLVVEVALAEGVVAESLLVDDLHAQVAQDLLDAHGQGSAPVFVLAREELSRLAGFNVTRGFLAAMRRPRERTVGEVLDGARHVALLEGLVDVTNVGAAFRNAAALGADAVVVSPRCADPLQRRACRTSMGCVLKVPWARAGAGEWPRGVVDLLHERGFECLALALREDAVAIDDPSFEGVAGSAGGSRVEGGPGAAGAAGKKRALFFGCEGYGLDPATIAACDKSVIIPMAHGVDSFNVATSSAVAFWQLFRD